MYNWKRKVENVFREINIDSQMVREEFGKLWVSFKENQYCEIQNDTETKILLKNCKGIDNISLNFRLDVNSTKIEITTRNLPKPDKSITYRIKEENNKYYFCYQIDNDDTEDNWSEIENYDLNYSDILNTLMEKLME